MKYDIYVSNEGRVATYPARDAAEEMFRFWEAASKNPKSRAYGQVVTLTSDGDVLMMAGGMEPQAAPKKDIYLPWTSWDTESGKTDFVKIKCIQDGEV